jgi:hypothetical protein
MNLLKSYEGGRESHAHFVVKSLFEEYLTVEELFSDGIQVVAHDKTDQISIRKKNTKCSLLFILLVRRNFLHGFSWNLLIQSDLFFF